MFTLYHAPMSRSSRLLTLIEELGAEADIEIRLTSIPRQDGSDAPDPANPHPDKKVPALVQDGTLITESVAIAEYLCDLYPDAGLLPAPGTPERAVAQSWLAYYQGVIEPVLVAKFVGVENPGFDKTFTTWDRVLNRIETALEGRDYLLGNFSAVDIILASTFQWMPSLAPEGSKIAAWVARCNARPSTQRTLERDKAAMMDLVE
jgi:glutathione S-transferase